MELTIRDWMVVIGAGIILAVLVDAARRVIKERRSEVRLNARITRLDQDGDEGDANDDFDLLSELPNGGARVVQRDDLQPPEDLHDDDPAVIADSSVGTERVHSDDVSDDAATVPYDQSEDATVVAEELDIPSFSALDDDDDDMLDQPPAIDAHKPTDEPAKPAPAETPVTLDWLDQLEAPEPEPEPEARLPRGGDSHVFVLNVVARSEDGFAGEDIMQILLGCDLRFGDMDFFHRHEHSAGRGPIQFSVCNMMKPGVFDIDGMKGMRTRGLMFFVTLPGPEDMLKAFDYMYETAKAVARNLNGDVLDETRSAVTRQSIEHMRQQIRELERRLAMTQRR